MKWPVGGRESNPSSGCHGSRCIVALGTNHDAKTAAHLYPIGFFGRGVYVFSFTYLAAALVFIKHFEI